MMEAMYAWLTWGKGKGVLQDSRGELKRLKLRVPGGGSCGQNDQNLKKKNIGKKAK